MDWTGLDWTRLNSIELDYTCIGLEWTDLNQTKFDYTSTESTRIEKGLLDPMALNLINAISYRTVLHLTTYLIIL